MGHQEGSSPSRHVIVPPPQKTSKRYSLPNNHRVGNAIVRECQNLIRFEESEFGTKAGIDHTKLGGGAVKPATAMGRPRLLTASDGNGQTQIVDG